MCVCVCVYIDIDCLSSSSCRMAIENASAKEEMKRFLVGIQERLQDINSILAADEADKLKSLAGQVTELEERIDSYSSALKPLKSFILPSGGGVLSTQLHISRAICRRAERSLCTLLSSQTAVKNAQLEEPEKYLNRLSDFLFVAARFSSTGPDNEYSSKQQGSLNKE